MSFRFSGDQLALRVTALWIPGRVSVLGLRDFGWLIADGRYLMMAAYAAITCPPADDVRKSKYAFPALILIWLIEISAGVEWVVIHAGMSG